MGKCGWSIASRTRKLYISRNKQVEEWFRDTFTRDENVRDGFGGYYSGYYDSLFWRGDETDIPNEIFNLPKYTPEVRYYYMMGWHDAQGDLDSIALRFNGVIGESYDR